VIDDGFAALQRWGVRIVVIAAATYVLGWAIGHSWAVWFPVVMAVLVTTVLAPPANWLKRRKVPAPLAAAVVMISFIALVAGIVGSLVPQVADQLPDIADRAASGLFKIRDWLVSGPLGLSEAQITRATEALQQKLQSSADAISAGVFTTIGAATSFIVNTVVVLILSFLFIKDGDRFLPWLGTVADRRHGEHAVEVLGRAWDTLGGFVRTQATVALVDSVLIGAGLLILDVKLALPLAVITFVGAFIPMIGAFVSGSLAVLVTLVTNSPRDALIAAIIVVTVQQLEGNVLSPMLQGKSMRLHPSIVLLAVVLGGTLFGVTGAFLAVPVAATTAEVLRYIDERIDLRTDGLPDKLDEPADL
jgi:predicted PurR-regulated permease PerM